MLADDFKIIAPTLPTEPGIYKYYDEFNTLIYVGKAKHIRKRVSSYFTNKNVNYKTQELVKRIAQITFTITNSEQDAFFLENALIKEYQPKYNINLKNNYKMGFFTSFQADTQGDNIFQLGALFVMHLN